MTREQFDDMKQSQQEYDDNIRADSNDIIHTLQEKLSACEESLATCQADLAQSEEENAKLRHQLGSLLSTIQSFEGEDIDSWELCETMIPYGLCERVPYNPDFHAEMGVDMGGLIVVMTEEAESLVRRVLAEGEKKP